MFWQLEKALKYHVGPSTANALDTEGIRSQRKSIGLV